MVESAAPAVGRSNQGTSPTREMLQEEALVMAPYPRAVAE
ncbi:hypothetical protein RCH21_000420 [Arthrobacter sp. PL16]|nr:hypothetical protein [Arthrobacter sp. PL16]